MTRTHAIKKALEQAFGRGKVRVNRGKGTAHSWVHVHIAYSPTPNNWQKMYSLVIDLASVAAAKSNQPLSMGFTDDTCQSRSPNICVHFA